MHDAKARFQALCEAQSAAAERRYEDHSVAHSWHVGRKKTFAVWQASGEQQGLHLRSNDPAFIKDKRVRPTSVALERLEKKHNFVWLDPTATWADAELKTRIAESFALATRKDGGIKRGGEFSDLFIVSRKALELAPESMRPAPPYHAGGPAAKIIGNEGPSSLALAVWAARSLAAFVPADEKKRFERCLELAENRKLDARSGAKGAADGQGSRALQAAKLTQLARLSAEGGYETRVSSRAAEVVCLAVAQLLETKKPAAKVKAFLEAVDDRVLTAEFAAVARSKLGRENVVCERVLWRGPDAKGNAGRWLARLSPKHYALISKVGTRWVWSEGSRDDMLATVPDAEFTAATQIAMSRDR